MTTAENSIQAKKENAAFAWVVLWLVTSFAGFADSVYMSIIHLKGELPSCSVIEGCVEVAISSYSTIGPVPVALLGAGFYTLMLVMGILWLDIRKSWIFAYAPYLTVPAFLFSLWLLYLMVFVIESLCMYCLISSLSTTLLLFLSFRLRKLS